MITYTFDKDKKTTKVEPNTKSAFLYIPNAVRLLLKKYTGEEEIKVIYDKVNDKAYLDKKCKCKADETTGSANDQHSPTGWMCNACWGSVEENLESEFYVECRLNIIASNEDVCINRINRIRDNSYLNDGYSNDYQKDNDCNVYESIMTGYYNTEKEAYQELKILCKKYKWLSIGEIFNKNSENIFCDLYD